MRRRDIKRECPVRVEWIRGDGNRSDIPWK
jgi:hypothetical protein